MIEILFWTGVFVVFYTYVGYGIAITVISKFRKHASQPSLPDAQLPPVTLVVAAWNEQDFIRNKIADSLALDYPKDKLKFLFVTDGSSDATPEIVKSYPQIEHHHEPGRRGKIHAVNRIMRFVKTPIVVFCDANTYLNKDAIRKIVRHYNDPQVGGVAGEKRIFKKAEDNASGAGEGLYWKYESYLKKKDSEVYSVVGAAGELFSVRTALYEPPDESMIIEDFVLSMSIAAKGYRFIYEPEAYATESASASVDEEWKRKVRICAGAFQAMRKLKAVLNPVRYGMLTFQYVSHRVLRWTLAPLFLPIIFLASLWLAITASIFYQFALLAQVLFYLVALLGHIKRNEKVGIKGFFVPYYFCVMNMSVYAGLRRYLKGKQSVVWEKAQRATMAA